MSMSFNFPQGVFFPSQETGIPLYHEGMLEVKLRRDTGAIGTAMAMGGQMLTRSSAAMSPGLGTLMAYERSGLIRRITSLTDDGRALATRGETPMLATMAAAAWPEEREDPNAGVTLVELYRDQDTQALEGELRRDPAIESVSRVPIRYLLASRKGPLPKSRAIPAAGPMLPAAAAPPVSALWNLSKIRWAEARKMPRFVDATQINVAVLDTGIDTGHPERPSNIAHYEFSHPTNASASSSRDIIGHGTHVSGTIAAHLVNNVGINGICSCALSMFKIFDDLPDWYQQQGYFAYFVDPAMYQLALSRCLTFKMRVINLSIGGPGAPTPNEQLLFSKLIQAGTAVVAAMGNENSSQLSYPAAIPGVIAVGATSINDVRASFSNYGGHITLTAPGQGIWSTLPTYPGNTGYRARPTFSPQPDYSKPIPRDTDYASWDGTSMATPHVTAAVALLLAKNPGMSPADIKQKLQDTVVKVPAMNGQNFTPEYGYGRLDLVNLLT